MPQTDVLVLLNTLMAFLIGFSVFNWEMVYSSASRFVNFFKVVFFALANFLHVKQKNLLLILNILEWKAFTKTNTISSNKIASLNDKLTKEKFDLFSKKPVPFKVVKKKFTLKRFQQEQHGFHIIRSSPWPFLIGITTSNVVLAFTFRILHFDWYENVMKESMDNPTFAAGHLDKTGFGNPFAGIFFHLTNFIEMGNYAMLGSESDSFLKKIIMALMGQIVILEAPYFYWTDFTLALAKNKAYFFSEPLRLDSKLFEIELTLNYGDALEVLTFYLYIVIFFAVRGIIWFFNYVDCSVRTVAYSLVEATFMDKSKTLASTDAYTVLFFILPWVFAKIVYLLIDTLPATLVVMTGTGLYKIIDLFCVLVWFYGIFRWFKDLTMEATFFGKHTKAVQDNLIFGFTLFVASEVMVFFGIFWSYLYYKISPSASLGGIWPPKGIQLPDPLGIAFANTMILIYSGTIANVSLRAVRAQMRKALLGSLVATIGLGFVFLSLQVCEYIFASFCISDSVFGSLFYFTTGAHGMHVLVGVIFLLICLIRAYFHHLKADHHLALILAVIYWHFVDIVWIVVYFIYYVWV